MAQDPAPEAADPGGSSLRRLAGDTGVYALARAAGPLASLVAVPVLARELGPAGFGTVDLLVALTAVAGMVAMLGMDSAAARSWFDSAMPAERRPSVIATAVRAVAAASLAMAAAGALAVLALGALSAGVGDEAAALLAVLTLPVVMTQLMVREVFRLEGRRGWYVAVAACGAVVGSGAAVVLVVAADMGAAGYFAGLGLGALAALALGAAAAWPALRAPLDRVELRVMLRYGLPLVPASIALWALMSADRAVVGAFRGVDEVGLYGLGSRITTPLLLAVQAFQVAWIPFALRMHRDAPAAEPRMRGRVAVLVLAATAAGGVVLVAFASPLARLLGGPGFEPAADAVLPLAVAWIAYAGSAIGFIPFAIERRSAAVARLSGACAAVGLGLAIALVPPFGFQGAAWATAASYVLLGALALRAGQRIAPAVFDLRLLAAPVAIAAVALPLAALADAGGGDLARLAVCGWAGVLLAVLAARLR